MTHSPACQSTPGPVSDDGWCYVDADASPPIGDPAVADQCVGLAKRRIRFTGDAAPPKGAHVALLPN